MLLERRLENILLESLDSIFAEFLTGLQIETLVGTLSE